jgi:hypothetical protein
MIVPILILSSEFSSCLAVNLSDESERGEDTLQAKKHLRLTQFFGMYLTDWRQLLSSKKIISDRFY